MVVHVAERCVKDDLGFILFQAITSFMLCLFSGPYHNGTQHLGIQASNVCCSFCVEFAVSAAKVLHLLCMYVCSARGGLKVNLLPSCHLFVKVM